jgi:esterase
VNTPEDVASDTDAESVREVADELGIAEEEHLPVRRVFVEVAPGQQLSALVWGTPDADLVLLHGGGQNSHTWDRMLVQLGAPAIAIDLPGHGHSSWRTDRDYGAPPNAVAVAVALERISPRPHTVVGMSLGGLTAIRLAYLRPDLVSRIVMVDVTPGTTDLARQLPDLAKGAVSLVQGPREFSSFEEIVNAVVEVSPRAPLSAVRRGVRNNAKELSDGRWVWRYDVPPSGIDSDEDELWQELVTLKADVMLVRGADSAFVADADVARLQQSVRSLRVETVSGSGHDVQGHQPLALARLIQEFGGMT